MSGDGGAAFLRSEGVARGVEDVSGCVGGSRSVVSAEDVDVEGLNV